jgi:GrpB-like predicted nucleotidyltransferase (UPF0157 family)
MLRRCTPKRSRLAPGGADLASGRDEGHNGREMSASEEAVVLGVADGRVWLADHSPEWSSRFAVLRAQLLDLIGDLVGEIEHVGSTAVDGLVAKPMLDVAIGIRDPGKIEEAVERLTRGGFPYRGDFGEEGGVIMFEGPPEARTAVIHVVEYSSRQWNNYLTFRDALNGDPELRDRYGNLKVELAGKYPGDRIGYLAGKNELIEEILGNR